MGKLHLGLVLLLALGGSLRAAPNFWSQGDPDADEQYALEWINSARADPVGTFNRLAAGAASDPVLAAFFAGEQPATASQLLASLQAAYGLAQSNSLAYPNSAAISQGPWVFYPLFQQQADAWSASAALPAPQFPTGRTPPNYLYPPPQTNRLLAGGNQGFSGPNATGGTASFGPFGATYSEVSQANLYEPALTGREYVLSLLCAPGSGSPPPDFLVQGDPLPGLTLGHTRMAGIDISPLAGGGRVLTVYRGSSEFLTQSDLPYGPAGTVFITGVAYCDLNSNSCYDPGEGIAGVTIGLDHGNWAATTASAGGYAIPVPANSGSYTVTATGGPFASATATVVVGADNVKLDWVLPAAVAVVPPGSGSAQLINLSARGLVGNGTDSLTAGFSISGPAAAQKRLLIRGVGPSLQLVGVPAADCIPSTQLQIFAPGETMVAGNTGWTTAADGGAATLQAAAQCGAFPLANWAGGGGDSALVISLPPGLYTAVVTPAPGATVGNAAGRIGLAEVYDLSPADGCRLVNLSGRSLVEAGEGSLVLGAFVAGSGEDRLLLRAAGPSLAPFGLAPLLSNPALTLYDSAAQPIAGNVGWSVSAQAVQIATISAEVGAFPFAPDGSDAALLTLAPAGSLTATAAAPGSCAAGLALLEVYEVP